MKHINRILSDKSRIARIFLALLITALFLPALYAQDWQKDQQFIDVNDVEMAVSNYGIWGRNHDTGGSSLYFPAGQPNKALMYCAGFAFLGKMDDSLRTACAQFGSEFQPGVILADGTPDNPFDLRYHVYKFEKGDAIDAEALAQGCPAEVLGDQMLFCVYNDLTDHEKLFGLPAIGLEVQQTVWAYNEPAHLRQTIFMRYRIINKNADGLTVDSAYVAIPADPDVGSANDDAIGYDADREMIYAFNGSENDSQYGDNVPAVGIDLLQGPTGAGNACMHVTTAPATMKHPVNGNVAWEEPFYAIGRAGAVRAFNFCRGFMGDGVPWYDPVAGENTCFPFSGDPLTGIGWLCQDVVPPQDSRMMLACGPFSLAPGEAQDVIVAVTAGGCLNVDGDRFTSIMDLRQRSDETQRLYEWNFERTALPDAVNWQAESTDRRLNLSWPAADESFESQGYAFEGYSVWLADNLEGDNARRVAVLDSANGITSVWYPQFDADSKRLISQPVIAGSDAGLCHHLTLENDPRTGRAFYIGEPVYAAVTAFAVNEGATPPWVEHEPEFKEILVQGAASQSAGKLENLAVFPNPYYGHNAAESGQYAPYVTVTGLPEDDCEITVFTLSGQLVQQISHNNGQSFHRVYLDNTGGRALASGMYLIHVKSAGGSKALKLAMVQRQAF